MNMISITVVVYIFLEWLAGSKSLEEVEGLDPMGTNSNVGPPGNTSSPTSVV